MLSNAKRKMTLGYDNFPIFYKTIRTKFETIKLGIRFRPNRFVKWHPIKAWNDHCVLKCPNKIWKRISFSIYEKCLKKWNKINFSNSISLWTLFSGNFWKIAFRVDFDRRFNHFYTLHCTMSHNQNLALESVLPSTFNVSQTVDQPNGLNFITDSL